MSLSAYVPTTAPIRSTFATLLKQSKFSSFDRTIGQVYTTHGGDAQRGNWGFKRPLPLRRRGAYITVKNVDTPEHQTEWSSAEPQALWMKNWDELKITPQLAKETGYVEDGPNEFITDSDYLPKSQDARLWRQAYIPNLDVMTRQEFKEYLEQIRTSRNSFYKNRKTSQASESSFYQLSNRNHQTAWQDEYARQVSRARRSDPRNKEIEHMPHSSGGLTYSHYSPLQTFMMTRERKGRLVEEHKGKDKNLMHYVASFGGMAGYVQKKNAGVERPMVWEDPKRTGQVMIRPQKAMIERLPNVVGWERQGLKGARLAMDLRVWDGPSHDRSNPHPLGSRKYIAAEPQTAFVPTRLHFGSARKTTIHKAVAASHQSTINVLNRIVKNQEKLP
ncbi:hypothetical protein PAXINDRAFT_168314 [Paxillus involutus ATCC 200175]|nr:hypothetical protein PAXINDRAFT_168314 [Paxillus involutus ATCC 200175]